MARRTALVSLQEISEINMTPLMDLTFILLITFIITFPLLEQGIRVNLPKAQAEELDVAESRAVTVDREGHYYLDDRPVTPQALEAELRKTARADPEILVLVRADEELRYARVVEVMKILHAAGISRMALVTEPEAARAGR